MAAVSYDAAEGIRYLPGTANRSRIAPPPLRELRRVMLYPPHDGRMRQANAAFVHYEYQIAIAQFKTEIPTNAQDHNLLVKVPAFEQLLPRYKSRHPSIMSAPRICIRARKRRAELFLVSLGAVCKSTYY
jgi:hypothetical protein